MNLMGRNAVPGDVLQREAAQSVQEYVNGRGWDGKLKTIYLYVGFNCNENCSYCWVINNPDINCHNVLNIEFVRSFLPEAIDLGVQSVKISGGEPLYNQDFRIHETQEFSPNILQIINYITENNIAVDVETNGTLIDNAFLSKIRQPERVNFRVSVDTLDESIYDSLSQTPGSFRKLMRGIKCLNDGQFSYDVITLATNENYDALHELIQEVEEWNNNLHRIIIDMQPIGRGKIESGLALSIPKISELMEYVYGLDRRTLGFGTLHSTLPPAFIPTDKLALNFCGWGEAMCGIMPNGDVSICAPAFETLGIKAGSLRDSTLSEIWQKSELFSLLRQKTSLKGICGKCIYAPACRGMCRIFAKAKYGELDSPYPFCQEMYLTGNFPQYAIIE